MKTPSHRKLISFDWAMKRLLRSKANFEILEGFLSELLNEDIVILEMLELKESVVYKPNTVDIKVRNSAGQIIIIQLQYERKFDYLQRMCCPSRAIKAEPLREGEPFSEMGKVISVNILYFDLGHGSDYIYRGTTIFTGIHDNDTLQLSSKQQTAKAVRQRADTPSLPGILSDQDQQL